MKLKVNMRIIGPKISKNNIPILLDKTILKKLLKCFMTSTLTITKLTKKTEIHKIQF